MCIYHALINALSAYMTHTNTNTTLYTHTEHSPTKTIYTKHYTECRHVAIQRGKQDQNHL